MEKGEGSLHLQLKTATGPVSQGRASACFLYLAWLPLGHLEFSGFVFPAVGSGQLTYLEFSDLLNSHVPKIWSVLGRDRPRAGWDSGFMVQDRQSFGGQNPAPIRVSR